MVQDWVVEDIRETARQMALSGRFCSWRLIEIELRFVQGVREAADCFADAAIRGELDHLCREAMRRTRPGLMRKLAALFPPIPVYAFAGEGRGGAAAASRPMRYRR